MKTVAPAHTGPPHRSIGIKQGLLGPDVIDLRTSCRSTAANNSPFNLGTTGAGAFAT